MNAPPEHVDLDLGEDHLLRFSRWSADRELNPQYAGIPDVERFGAIIYHRRPDGIWCMGGLTFDSPSARALGVETSWMVESWDPLSISPSVLCRAPVYGPDGTIVGECGDHGYVRDGRWVRA